MMGKPKRKRKIMELGAFSVIGDEKASDHKLTMTELIL